jgi:hypothetical protein
MCPTLWKHISDCGIVCVVASRPAAYGNIPGREQSPARPSLRDFDGLRPSLPDFGGLRPSFIDSRRPAVATLVDAVATLVDAVAAPGDAVATPVDASTWSSSAAATRERLYASVRRGSAGGH